MWLILEGSLAEDASAEAYIDERALRVASGADADDQAVRHDPRRYDFEIQVSAVGGATSVTVEGLGPAGLWTEVVTGLVVGDVASVDDTFWRALRLVWTGGAPSGAGTASFWATPKFNGLMK